MQVTIISTDEISKNETPFGLSSASKDSPQAARSHAPHRKAAFRKFLAENNAQVLGMPKELALQANGNPPSYAELECTEKDKKLIAELTHDLAKHNHFWFIIHAHELKKKVKVFKHRVHVLKMLETVFTNPRLKDDILEVYNDPDKWDAVVTETYKKMRKMEKKGLLYIYMNDFATAIGAPPKEIQVFFLRKDWEGLLTYLVNRMK